MKKVLMSIMTCLVIANLTFGQSLVNVEKDKTLYLGENLIDTCSVSFNQLSWSYEDACIYRYDDTDKSPFVFMINTQAGKDYYFYVNQDEGTLTNAFHVGIGNGKPTDPYNLTTKMAVLIRADGGHLKIYPISGKSFKLSVIRFSEISDTITTDRVILPQNSVSIGVPQSSVGGKWNVAIGDTTTMANNLNATRSIAIGHNSLTNLESGIQNIGIGTFSLYELQYGERNIGFGPDALYRTKNAFDNVAIGRGVLANEAYSEKDITLERNTAIGNFAILNNTESTHDAVAIGYMANRDGGNESVSIGNYAGRNGGDRNISIGFNAGVLNKSNDNVIIGYRALRGDDAQGEGNVVIGSYANVESSQGIVNNGIAIGQRAVANNQSVAIGANSRNTKENQVVIGTDAITETVVYGDLIVKGTDGIERIIFFKDDGSVGWKEVDANTAITQTKANNNYTHGIYDLNGIAVPTIKKAGFYIINGEKMYVDPSK